VNNSPAGCRQALKHWLHLSQFICNVAVWVTCTNLSSIRYPQWMLLMQFVPCLREAYFCVIQFLRHSIWQHRHAYVKFDKTYKTNSTTFSGLRAPFLPGRPFGRTCWTCLNPPLLSFCLIELLLHDRQYATRTAASPHRGRSREWQGPWVAWSPKYSAANYGISFQVTQQTDGRLLRCKE